MILQAEPRKACHPSPSPEECMLVPRESRRVSTGVRNVRSRRTLLRNGIFVALAWILSACSTLRVPAARPDFNVNEFAHTEAGGIVLRARAIVDQETYSDLFDDDLPRLGIIATWVSLENQSREEAAVDPGKWHLQIAGSRHPAMSSDDVVDLYYQERHIRIYAETADERARGRLEKLSLEPMQLAPGASAQGFVFFRIGAPPPPSWNLDATLMATGIKLGGGRKLDMHLPLYAHS
jgi:hypothetical protein